MDVRFLKEISEAYVIDTELDISPEKVFDDLYDIVTFIREYDNDLYNELYESTKLNQQRIFKRYLDFVYELVEWTDEDDEIISEEAVTTGLVIGGATLAKLAVGILSAISTLLLRKPLTTGIMKGVAFLGKWIERMGNFLSKQGKYAQLRYSIIQENTRKCYVRCGISDPSKISELTYFSIRSSSGGTKLSADQAKCLRECYVEHLIEVIALHMECYFACLKKTGGFEAFNKTDPDDVMKMISSVNISSACESFYIAAKDALDNFYRTIEFIYDKQYDEDKRFDEVKKLRERIFQARLTVQRAGSRELGRYGSEPQRK